MRKINIVTTMEVPNDWNTTKIYEEFNKWITNAAYWKDLSVFTFTDADTDEELEE